MARDVKTLAKNYRMIHDIVREQGRGTHLSVADVYALAKRRRPGIGETTVYRALARLRELGLVSEIQLPGADNAFYEPAGEAHAHFRCEACGKVEDVEYTLAPNTIAELADKHGAEVSEVLLSLHGRCSQCKDRGA
jgi:Fur family transcriptional regulator, ferric uptake regulator